MNDTNEAAKKVVSTYPAARAALDEIGRRLNAPIYVRAWHQLKGDEGWGLGDDLVICAAVLALIVFASLAAIF